MVFFSNFSAPYGKRSWKMFYCTLRDLVLYLHKDEHGFKKTQVSIHVVFHSLNWFNEQLKQSKARAEFVFKYRET